MKPDPPVTANCAQCGKPRQPERSRKYGGVEAETDPFCSASCCRAWHGTALPERKGGDRKRIPICGTSSALKSGCRCESCRAYGVRTKLRTRQNEEARV